MKAKITSHRLFVYIFLCMLFSFSTSSHAGTLPEYIRFASIKVSGPTAVAVDISENLYIAEAGKNHLLIYGRSGQYLRRLTGLDRPISVAVGHDGRIFIGNDGRGNVEVFDADLDLLFKLGAGDGEFKQPTAIAVDSTGHVYVADGKENKIKVYHFDGSRQFSFGASGSGDGEFNSPTAIAVDENAGEVIVCDLQLRTIRTKRIEAARVQFFDLDGHFLGSFGDFGVGEGLLVKPLGMDVDAEGRIYITDAYQNVVQIFDHNGDFLEMLYDADHPLRNPLAIAVSRNTNRLFVASLNTESIELYKEAGDNILPTADAGPDQTADEGDAVLLNAGNSKDPDDGIVSYLWEQTGGTEVALSDGNSVQVRFTAPDVGPGGDTLTFQLTVTDHGGQQSFDTCTVHVTWVNALPMVDTGPEQTVHEGDEVRLDGSASKDVDDGIASYLWEQTGGTEVSLSDSSSVQASFTAPDVGPGGETLTFQLTVTDHAGQESANICMVNVALTNTPPTAKASGPDQPVIEGTTVILDGSGSTDPDDGIVSYLWKKTKGRSVKLSDPTASQPTFVAPPVPRGKKTLTLSFRLTVTDKGGLKDTDEISITIHDNGIKKFPHNVISIKSCTGHYIGLKENGRGNITALYVVDPLTIKKAPNRPKNLIYGLLAMQIRVADRDTKTAKITVCLPSPAPKGYKWFFYKPAKGWIDFSRGAISKGLGDGAEFNKERTEVTLYITDNSDYDDDPKKGLIKDPSGLGILAGSEEEADSPVHPGGGGDSGGGGCFITTLLSNGRKGPCEETPVPARETEGEKGLVCPAPKNEVTLSREAQQTRSVEVFHEILALSRSKKRSDNLEQMISLYHQIITHCPDVPLAHESYWRLIEIFFKDFSPPEKDRALSLYKEFRCRYPDSPLKNAVEVTVRRFLYLNGYWNDLLAFASPKKEDFNDPKALKSPLPMFYYSEAKFHFNDFQEASKGYNIILKYFPDSRMAVTARKRMEEIKEKKDAQ